MKKFIVLDLTFYVALPYIIWNYGRDPVGDYYAMLLSTVPGFFYTIYRFARERQFNIAGLSIVLSLFLSTMVNLLSKNAESMLWNQVYLGYSYGVFFLVSVLIRKPLALRFAADFASLQGFPKDESLKLFSQENLFKWFQFLTLLFFLSSTFQNSLKAWLIHLHGADGYGEMLIYMKVSGWIFYGLILGGFFFVGSKVNLQLQKNSEDGASLSSQEQLQIEKQDSIPVE